VVEVPVDIHDAALSTSPLIPSPVSPISKVNLAFYTYSMLLYVLQCFCAVGWVTGRSSGLYKAAATFLKGSALKTQLSLE